MRAVFVAVCVLALSTAVLAASEQEEARPKWIAPENPKWPQWGIAKLNWLKRERREAVRDKDDAVRELAIVRSWARTYVRNRVGEIVAKAGHRADECKHFNSLHKIRSANYGFHRGAHRRRHHRSRRHHRGPWHKKHHRKHHRKGGKGKRYAWRKYTLHARMLIQSRDRLAAAKRARARCWATVKRLRGRKAPVEAKARATARRAVIRAQKHVQNSVNNLKKVDGAIAKQWNKIKARRASYKTYYFHKCHRAKRFHKFKCVYSIRHGGGDYARLPHKFRKCLWQSSNAVVVRYVCYK